MNLEEGDTVLCTVDRIVGTNVFVQIEDYNGLEGSIVISEIAPGRIRNLRDYVIPKKKIVCKILRINKEGNIELSLRRVSNKEKKEVTDKYKQEKRYENIIKTILKEKTKETIDKIKEKTTVYNLILEAKENPKELEKIVGKENAEKILEILGKEKQKKSIVKKEIKLTSNKPDGLTRIKNILKENAKNSEIVYIAGGKYLLKLESSELKKADQELQEIIKNLEKDSKARGIEFSEIAKSKK